jgi:dynein heavy chain
MEIESETTVKRWDFTKTKEIFVKPKYMKQVLDDIKEACTVLKEFSSILGPDLKAVTGSSEQIDMVTDKVRDQIAKLEDFPHDVFNQDYEKAWWTQFNDFKSEIDGIEKETCLLINTTVK